jgi:hypothetical protein
MLETLLGWVVVLLPLLFGVAVESFRKDFRETTRYRWGVWIFALITSVFIFFEMNHERHKAESERATAIQDTATRVSSTLSKQYSETVIAQKLEIQGLEAQIKSQSLDVKDIKKDSITNAAQLRLLWEETQAGKQKRQVVIDKLKLFVERSKMPYGKCMSVGPVGSGGIRPLECLEVIGGWTRDVQSYVSGSLGEAYEQRFIEAAYPANVKDHTSAAMDGRTASEIERPLRELDSEVAILKQFIKEIGG